MANTLKFKRGLLAGLPTAAEGEPLFTTDTKDLYIGTSSGNQRFQKYIASGATTQILRGDGSLYTFPLAISSPSAGQVLKYNGTSWVNDSDAGITGSGAAGQVAYFTGATTQGGSNNLFWDTANARLGIGTNIPSTRLHIVSSSGNADINLISPNNQGSFIYYSNGSGLSESYIGVNNSAGTLVGGIGGAYGTFIASYNSRAIGIGINGVDAIRINGSTRNVHIGGTSDNGLRFQVTGSGYFSGNINLPNSGEHYIQNLASTTFIGLNFDTPYIRFATSNTERMRLDASGNLGLGVVPSAWASTWKAIQVQNAAFASLSSLYAFVGQNWYNDGASKFLANGRASLYQQYDGVHSWYYTASNSSGAGAAITFTQAMTLDASGRLGIGTTSPTEFLQVNGAVRITGAITNNTTGGILAYQGSGNTLLGAWGVDASTRGFITFYLANSTGTTGSEFMRLNSTGNLLIRTTTDTGEALQVNGTMRVSGASTFSSTMTLNASTTSAYAAIFNQTNTTSDVSFGLLVRGGTTTGDVAFRVQNAAANQNLFSVLGNGTTRIISAGGSAFTQQLTLQNNTANPSLIAFENTANGVAFGFSSTGTQRFVFINGALSEIASISGAGAATFSSSVTAANRTILGAGYIADLSGSGNDVGIVFSSAGILSSNGAGTLTAKNLGSSTYPWGNLFAGAATFSSTVSATSYRSAGVELMTSDGTSNYIKTGATLFFQSGATTLMSLTTGGNFAVDTNTLFVDAANNRVGVGTSSPTSSLHVVGSVTKSHTTKTANYTMTESDYTVLCDTSAGGFTISLPAASGCSGRIYVVKKITGNSGTNNITIDPNGSETIDGSTTYTLQCRSSVMIQSNGANWWILAERVDNSCI